VPLSKIGDSGANGIDDQQKDSKDGGPVIYQSVHQF
jgi:hypothetical protein